MAGRCGLERVFSKLKKSVEEGHYYEAHQMYRTIYFRYMSQQKYDEILQLLYDGSILLFQHNQTSSGADLSKLYVEALMKSKASVKTNVVFQLGEMMSRIPSTAPERQAFISSALSWSQMGNPEHDKFEGHPQLHKMIANIYWRETKYHMANYHFLRSDDMQNLGSMLVEIQVVSGYRNEIDLVAAQAVLQILCIRSVAVASRVASDLFLNYVKQHPSLGSKPPFKFPLLNFIWLLLLSLESSKTAVFAVLCEHYQPSLRRDPSYREYLERIGQVYFGMAPPRNQSRQQGVFGNLIQSLIGSFDDDSDSENGDPGSNRVMQTSELD